MKSSQDKITFSITTTWSSKKMALQWTHLLPAYCPKFSDNTYSIHIFLNEHTNTKFINYFRYVDDILLIYDSSHRDIHTILDDFNSTWSSIKFANSSWLKCYIPHC